MRRAVLLCAIALVMVATGQSQPKKLKVYISADMEGIGGVSSWQIQAG